MKKKYIIQIGDRSTSFLDTTILKAIRSALIRAEQINPEDMALELAAERLYGKGAWFIKDSVHQSHGQVWKALPTGGSASVTDLVRFNVDCR